MPYVRKKKIVFYAEDNLLNSFISFENNSRILLHVPHSSTYLPDVFPINEKTEYFNIKMTDLYTDKLFMANEYESIIFPYSRLFCDAERYLDDEKEDIAKIGQGFLYTNYL